MRAPRQANIQPCMPLSPTLTSRILAELAAQPGTAVEIAAELDEAPGNVTAMMSHLLHRGLVKVTGHGMRGERGRYPRIYALK